MIRLSCNKGYTVLFENVKVNTLLVRYDINFLFLKMVWYRG
jgi:hypothetical protein